MEEENEESDGWGTNRRIVDCATQMTPKKANCGVDPVNQMEEENEVSDGWGTNRRMADCAIYTYEIASAPDANCKGHVFTLLLTPATYLLPFPCC